jgi:stage III sporulation protein AC
MSSNIDMIFKIASIGILLAVLHQVLTRSGREEMATMTSLTGIIVVLFMVIQLVNNLFTTVRTMFQLY